jgi:site-specific DNA-methyltransferase (adenine-specific)
MSTSGWQLHQADAVDWLGTLAPDSVDLVITDPPYESLEKHRAVGTTTRLKPSKASSNDWFRIFPNDRFPGLFAQVFRVLRPDRHFYLFCDSETAFIAKPMAEQAGFKFWKPLIWDKQRIGMGYHYRARYEFILFFEKRKRSQSGRKLADLGVPDVISAPRVHKGYPAEKPLSVLELLVRQSACPGELVIDPFMGSGSTGLAAVNQGCRFAGNDIADVSLDLTRRRLDSLLPFTATG